MEVARVAEANGAAVLARLSGSPLIEAGRVQLIGLDALRDQFGAAWAERRSRVYERVESHAARLLDPADLFLRVGELDFLLVSAAPTAAGARGAAVRLLRDVLSFFFGEVEPSSLVIKTVTALDADGLVARRLSPAEVAEAAPQTAASGRPAAPRPGCLVQSSAGSAAHGAILTPIGQGLAVEHRAAPLLDLRRGVEVGWSVWRRVLDERTGAELTSADVHRLPPLGLEAIDLAAIGYGEGLVQAATDAGRSLVVMPISLATLGAPRGRQAMLGAMRAAQTHLASRVIVEMTGLSQGFLTTRVREGAAVIKPYCRAVFAQIPPLRCAAEQLRGCGLRGASLLAADLARSARIDPDSRKMTEAAALVGPGLMICGLRTARAAAAARALGASLAVLDPDYAAGCLQELAQAA